MKRICYTPRLIQLWKKSLVETFGFEEYMDFIVQPSFGKKYLSYLPLLNYTDKTSQEAQALLELAKDNHYQIRTLNFEYKDFKDHDTVTLRLDIEGKSLDQIVKGYKKLAKRSVNKEKRLQRYHLQRAHSFIEAFYDILRDIYKHHGTPLMPITLFYNLAKNFGEDLDIFILFNEKEEPVGGVLFFYDNGIATLLYGGVYRHKNEGSTGYFLYHELIRYLISKPDIHTIDFGRSPYNGGTYFFKTRFGAIPIKIDILTDTQKDIYASYALASKIWSKLPTIFTDFVGPKLTKYLVDL